MGKQKKITTYEQKGLEALKDYIYRFRKALPNQTIPNLGIKTDDLERAVKSLPKGFRESLEKFWGLKPGTNIHGKSIEKISLTTTKDVAYINMLNKSNEAIKEMLEVEYLYILSSSFKKVIDKILAKIDKKGCEQVSDMDAIKYLLILIIFIEKGPNMIYDVDLELKIEEAKEKAYKYDTLALLMTVWESNGDALPDNSINLKLLISSLEMLDLKDVVTMKNYVRLPIEKNETPDPEKLESFMDIRKFKERVFCAGPWNVTCDMIFGKSVSQEQIEKLLSHFHEFRSNWDKILELKKESKILETSKGKKEVALYEVEGLQFTDVYELINLFVNWRYL